MLPDAPQVWAFDCEWVPDVAAGRKLYDLHHIADDRQVLQTMWQNNGATDEDPQPFLKTILCRVVSIAAVMRKVDSATGEAMVALWSVPSLLKEEELSEKELVKRFLDAYSLRRPTLVGYNSRNADMHILRQRAIVNGLQNKVFAEEAAAKPWNSASIDLMEMVGRPGKGYTASLNEVAVQCGFPGKIETTGYDVADMFYAGRIREIVEYNMFDAITTYLLWLRIEYFKGNFTAEQYEAEQQLLRQMLEQECEKPYGRYLQTYLTEWDKLK